MVEHNNRWRTLKDALIISVVVGHFCQLYLDRNLGRGITKAIFCFIYSFHMPLFVFISGYFSKNLEKRRKTAFEGLLILYLLAQIVIGSIVLVTDRNLNILKNPLFASYGTWYLIDLYIWRTLMPELVKIKKLLVFAILAFFVTSFFWGMDNTLGLHRGQLDFSVSFSWGITATRRMY